MKKLMMAFFWAMVCAVSSAGTLPSWAVGTFKGDVENWCYVYDDPDDIGPWYGKASFTMAADGNMSGELKIDDLRAKPVGNFSIQAVSDSEVWLVHDFKWTENGRYMETIPANIYIRNSAGVVTLEYCDEDPSYDKWEACPVQGVLQKSGGAVFIPVEWQKARTLNGLYGEGCWGGVDGAEGTAQLKCGKANKKGVAKVSLTIKPFVGKKRTYKSVSVDVSQGGRIEVRWPKQKYAVTIDGDGFFGEPIYEWIRPACSPNAVWSADVGGSFNKTAWFDFGDIPNGDVPIMFWMFEETDATVVMSGSKWKLPKKAVVKKLKCPKGATCGIDWQVDSSGDKTNLPGLKLTYNPKTGIFKGGFDLYPYMGKKYMAKVIGVMVNGVGHGQALCPKLSPEPWAVTIK